MAGQQQETFQSAASAGYWADRFVAWDPALDAFRTGLRAVLTAALATGLLYLLTRWTQQSMTLSLIGVVVPMMSTVAIQDPGRPQQRLTMMLIPVVASAAILLGSVVAGNPWLSGGFFLATIFAAFEARRFGPRGTALGMIAYLSYFYSMFLTTSLAKMPWLALFIVVGCAVGYAVRFWLVPDRPSNLLRCEVRAFRARISALLYELARHAAESRSERWRRRARASLSALNDLSLEVEDRLARFSKHADRSGEEISPEGDDLRSRVLRCEIAAEAIFAATRAAADDGRQPAREGRLRMAALLRTLRDSVRSPMPFDPAAFGKAVSGAGLPIDADLRWRFCRAARTLTDKAAWKAPLPDMRDEPVSPSQKEDREHGRPKDGGTASRQDRPAESKPGRFALDDNTRHAIQACVAALAAMLVGRAISDSRWYWAVIAAFVVFTRAMTLGQALSQAWQRVLATVAGVGIGLVIAELVHGSRDMELVLLFVFVAAGFYLFRAYQAVYVMLLTTMLAILYELIGHYTPGVLYIRLEETLAGAAAAAISAAVILPVRTSEVVDQKSAALLHEASGLLRSVFDEPGRPAPRDAVRDLDRKLQELRQALGPVTGASYPGPKAARRRRLHRLSILVYCIRHLYSLSDSHPSDAIRTPMLRDSAHAIAENMESLAGVFEKPGGKPHAGAEPKDLPRKTDTGEAERHDGATGDQWRITANWLWESNDILRAMYREAAS